MKRVETIKKVFLLAYYDKAQGKIGSMRFCDANDKKALELARVMQHDLDGHIRITTDRLREAYKDRPEAVEEHRELEELKRYYEQLSIVVIKAPKEEALNMEAYRYE